MNSAGWAFLGCVVVSLAASSANAGDYAWGAISIDASSASASPAYGIGGGASESEATDNAQKFCKEAGGGKGCKVMVTYEKCAHQRPGRGQRHAGLREKRLRPGDV
jgi:hypothetical protein